MANEDVKLALELHEKASKALMCYVDSPNGKYSLFISVYFLGAKAKGALDKAMIGEYCPVGAGNDELIFVEAVEKLCGVVIIDSEVLLKTKKVYNKIISDLNAK